MKEWINSCKTIGLKFTNISLAKNTLELLNTEKFAGERTLHIHIAAVPESEEIRRLCEQYRDGAAFYIGSITIEKDIKYERSLLLLLRSCFSDCFYGPVVYLDEREHLHLNDLSIWPQWIYEELYDNEYITAIKSKFTSFTISYQKWRELEMRCI